MINNGWAWLGMIEQFVELLQDGPSAHDLAELDLSNNMLSFNTCQKLTLVCPEVP